MLPGGPSQSKQYCHTTGISTVNQHCMLRVAPQQVQCGPWGWVRAPTVRAPTASSRLSLGRPLQPWPSQHLDLQRDLGYLYVLFLKVIDIDKTRIGWLHAHRHCLLPCPPHHNTSHCLASHHFASHPNASHPYTPHHITSHLLISHPIRD